MAPPRGVMKGAGSASVRDLIPKGPTGEWMAGTLVALKLDS